MTNNDKRIDLCCTHGMKLSQYASRQWISYVETLSELSGRGVEVVHLAENDRKDLLADLTSILYSFMTRLYGRRLAKRKTEVLVHQLQEENEKGEP